MAVSLCLFLGGCRLDRLERDGVGARCSASHFGRSPVISSPVISKWMISAMLVAWSPMRSRFLAMNNRCAPGVIVRGSPIM